MRKKVLIIILLVFITSFIFAGEKQIASPGFEWHVTLTPARTGFPISFDCEIFSIDSEAKIIFIYNSQGIIIEAYNFSNRQLNMKLRRKENN